MTFEKRFSRRHYDPSYLNSSIKFKLKEATDVRNVQVALGIHVFIVRVLNGFKGALYDGKNNK